MKTIQEIYEFGKQNNVPIIKEDTKDYLVNFVKEHKPNNILEIGTAIGYSGAVLISAYENAKLTTIEKDKERFDIAKQNFIDLQISDRVNIINGDAGEVLENLTEKYDLVFIDGPKGQYFRYLPKIMNLVNSDAYIIADNLSLHGLVTPDGFVKHKHRAMVVNLRKFIHDIQNHENLETEILEIGDRISISRVIGGNLGIDN